MIMKKILVANRGEIAIRIMRSAKEMGILTVAVYSEADRNSLHVRYADEAVLIGAAPSNQSYLLSDKIIEVCKQLNVDAVHPGYGFLSENADFAKKVTDAGIIFIGPEPEAIKIMGDKLSAKAAVKSYDIPMVPGTDTAMTDIQEAKDISKEIGYPILIKAAAGGGGKGMRIVPKDTDFEEQMELAVNEATSAFGNGAVFIEKYVESPRHIEIQILADSHGNIVHLFERECSIQRRHQKVIEEAPSSVLNDDLREKMGQTAIDVARACNYSGAGTVEFLYDKGNYYFLEMNTRLQVEHLVTEYVTGLDLVKEQIKIARGEKLSYKQSDIKLNGHSIELRVYAEDPKNNFLPDIGKLELYKLPQGNGVRVDDAYEQGMEIPIYYDPMIAKLATYGKTRQEAIDRMKRAINEYRIVGIETTLSFGRFVMENESFISGNYNTHFVQDYYNTQIKDSKQNNEEVAAIVMASILNEKKYNNTIKSKNTKKQSNWRKNRL